MREKIMLHALRLAARGLGNVWPNPAVGCVIVKDNVMFGRGWTQPGGRPHAEAMALVQAGAAARDAEMYVTLEPCCQLGRGPACTDAIIAASIKKIIIAIGDPHPRVNGQGIAALRSAGIEVELGVCADEAAALNKGFLLTVTQGRPMVTLKLAVSADWKLTTGNPAQQWITDEDARRHGHMLRATHDAILVGIGTVLADDPMLDCRIAGLEKFSPVRVVLDRHNRMSASSKLMQTANQIPLWMMKEENVSDVLKILADKGITRLLVEGGAKIAQAFLDAGLVDEIAIYQSPEIIGEAGLAAPELPPGFMQSNELTCGTDSYRKFIHIP